MDQFKTAMTSEEKAKLYQAIGYHEGLVDLQLPEDYVALTMHFNLKMLEVCVRNEIINPADLSTVLKTVLSLQVCGVSAEIDQRPASSGLKLDFIRLQISLSKKFILKLPTSWYIFDSPEIELVCYEGALLYDLKTVLG